MNGAHFEERLPAYLEGDLSEGESADVRRHLASCVECSALLKSLEETREILTALPEPNPSPALLGRLHSLPKKSQRRTSVIDLLLRPSLQPMFAGAAAVLVFISFLAFSSEGRSLKKDVNRRLHSGYSRIEKLCAKAGALTDRLEGRKEAVLGSLKESKILEKNGG